MTEYRYVYKSFDTDETIDIPDDAIGVTVDTFVDFATVTYLIPENDNPKNSH